MLAICCDVIGAPTRDAVDAGDLLRQMAEGRTTRWPKIQWRRQVSRPVESAASSRSCAPRRLDVADSTGRETFAAIAIPSANASSALRRFAEAKSPALNVRPGVGAPMTSQQIASIVDAHVHFWNLGRLSYPWLAAMRRPDRSGTMAQSSAAISPTIIGIDLHGLTLEACVHIQANCADPRGETPLWLEECAQRTGLPTALIAFVDLRHPRAEEELEWLAA